MKSVREIIKFIAIKEWKLSTAVKRLPERIVSAVLLNSIWNGKFEISKRRNPNVALQAQTTEWRWSSPGVRKGSNADRTA